MKKTVAFSTLNIFGTRYGDFLTYPRIDLEVQAERIKELQKLHVSHLIFFDRHCHSDSGILGKGCVGIVVIGHWRGKKIAVKIRRTDADRDLMQREAKLLERANHAGVGPKMYAVSDNFLLMQLIDGRTLSEWLPLRKNPTRVQKVLRDILEQCWRLDQTGLDHGELSHAPKHIIVHNGGRPFIVDFETASVNRKPANVTSVCQFLFLGGAIRRNLAENVLNDDHEGIIDALRRYKIDRTRESFENVLSACGLQTT